MTENQKKPMVILTGPTAVGKTELSIRLAKAIGAEIISADSAQVYRGMDIGSAKITQAQMQGVPHHLIDILDPGEEFHVALFQRKAKQAAEDIDARGHIPLIVGGTGFYIKALLYGAPFSEGDVDEKVRERYEEEGRLYGTSYLEEKLKDYRRHHQVPRA